MGNGAQVLAVLHAYDRAKDLTDSPDSRESYNGLSNHNTCTRAHTTCTNARGPGLRHRHRTSDRGAHQSLPV